MSNRLAEVFRERVRERMAELGWSQGDLAEHYGVNKSYVSHLLRGYRNPGLDTLERMAEVLGVEATWLISEKIPV